MRKKKYNHPVTFHEYLLGSCPHISVELAFQNQAKFQFHGLDTLWGFRATGGTKGRGRPAGRKELISLVNYAYYFLRRHDREWLEANQPPSRKPSPPPRKVDWKGEDAKIAAAIKLAAGKILKAAGRPARVSKASIIRGGRQS